MKEPMPRSFRFALFIKKLTELPEAVSDDEARSQLNRTLNEIEDEFSGTPFNPDQWQNDGRMYPPQDDRALPVKGHPELIAYRTKGHRIYIRTNGAILIEEAMTKQLVLAKPGQNGRSVFDS